MSTVYTAYGLGVQANASIPGMCVSSTTQCVDVQVWLGLMPDSLNKLSENLLTRYTTPYVDERGEPVLRVSELADGSYFHLHYANNTKFFIDRSGAQVWVTWPESLTLEDTATYLLGPVLGFILRLRGCVRLHASAVVVDGQALAILGPAGAGKSTTAAAFARLGYKILTDDIVALDERNYSFLVRPAYPRVRLWPASVHALYGAEDALPLLTPTWDKRYLDLTQVGYGFQDQPLPLAAVYVLSERSDEATAPFVEAVTSRDGLMTLVTNTYANYLLDRPMREYEFVVLSRLIDQVPMRKVIPHSDPSRLSQLCETILADFHGLKNCSAGHSNCSQP